MVAAGCPLMAGEQARMTAPGAFLLVLKPAASPLRNPRSCRRMTGGGVPATIRRPWRGRPRSSRLSLGDPSRVDFRLVFYPLVTPLRRDDQGLLSDEASGFTSCAACERHLLIHNGSWGHGHGYCVCHRLYTMTIFPNDQFRDMPTACVCGLVFRFAKQPFRLPVAALSSAGSYPLTTQKRPFRFPVAALSSAGSYPLTTQKQPFQRMKGLLLKCGSIAVGGRRTNFGPAMGFRWAC